MNNFNDKKREIMREYEKKRMKAESDAEERKKNIEERFPELLDIEEEIKNTGMNILKKVLSSGVKREVAMKECELRMDELKEKKRQVFVKNSIPYDYAEPKYECTVCNDTGMLIEGGRCKCYEQQLIEETSEASNIKNLLDVQNFESMDLSIFSDEVNSDGRSQLDVIKKNIRECLEFIERFDEVKSSSLLFYGTTGVGKTFLSSCIAKVILSKGYTVMYKTSSQYIDLAREFTFGKDNSEVKEEYKFLEKCDLLIIDDLGTEMTNKFVVNEIYKIVNARLIGGKKVIISTNLNLREINDVYTSRVFYRLVEGYKMLEFIGPNLRMVNLVNIFNENSKGVDS